MPSALATEALSATAVTKHFGGLVAVEDMSFQLAEKQVLGLIGPNGSGKTTMMNLISGALRRTPARSGSMARRSPGSAPAASRRRASPAPFSWFACFRR